jgi:signal transduction histidine kinase/ActR/RegA family two-component response regulator
LEESLPDQRSLTDRLLDQLVEQTQDHQAVLKDLSALLESHAANLIEAWSQAYRQVTAQQPLDAKVINLARQATLAQTLFGELKQSHLRQAFASWATWSRDLALAGLPFDSAHQLIREMQRATLTLAMPLYKDDAQLPLVLDALDDWFDSAVTLAGATYVEAQQPRAPEIPPPPQIQPRFTDAANLQVLGQLTSGMTHALNNLFAILVGQTQLLSEHVTDYGLRDELETLHNTASLGARMIRRLQAYTETQTETPRAIDVNTLLRDAAALTRFLWRDQAEATGVIIDLVQDLADVPPVLAQPTQLRHALVAFILNAIEAMPHGGLITLRTERKGESVLIAIIDNGDGMPDNIRARALDPFFTTKPSPHLGLGLTLAAKIVSDHKGQLEIESKHQRGTTVTITLPIAPTTRAKESKPMTVKRPARILVIDNEPAVRLLLTRLLTMRGHSVVEAESGIEGLAAFKKQTFDLVLTDLGMPEMSGWEVAREIKKLNAKTLVALTTGWPIELSAEELKAKGVDKVVNKPFDLPTLYALAEEAVALSESK